MQDRAVRTKISCSRITLKDDLVDFRMVAINHGKGIGAVGQAFKVRGMNLFMILHGCVVIGFVVVRRAAD